MKILSPKTHTILGLIVGIALLFAPNIFGFNDVGGAATSIPTKEQKFGFRIC
jgi:hypothetical protein